MKVLVYDTETTGLPDWKKPSEDPCQPRIVQLCAELVDDGTREVLAAMHCIIKPEGWTVPKEVSDIHGITTEHATAHGLPIGTALPYFLCLWSRADRRVAHNESFDMRMVRIEMMRDKDVAEHADRWKAAPAFCTQANSTAILNLPPTAKMLATGRRSPKSPNLAEAYQFFTGKPLEGAHRADVDVMACKAVYFGIRERLAKAA